MFDRSSQVITIMMVSLLATTLACGSTTDAVPTEQPGGLPAATEVPEQSSSDSATDTPEPTEAPTEVDISVIPLNIVDAAAPSAFYSDEEGKRLVGVEVAVDNNSSGNVAVNPLNATLIDDQGLAHAAELAAAAELDQIATLTIYPGEKARGWIFFSVEEGSSPAKLRYELNMFTDQNIEADLTSLKPDTEWPAAEPSLDYPPLGEKATVSNASLTALSVVDPSEPSLLYTPKEGVRLVSVEIQVKNESGSDPLSVNPLNSYLVDDRGFVHAVELGAAEIGQIDTLDLAAGEAARGYVSFEVPEGRSPLYIRFATDVFEFEDPLVAGLQE